MNKQLVSQSEIFDLIVNCYQTDNAFIKKYHELSGSTLSACVDRTVSDFINNNVNVYKLTDKEDLIGYFGEHNNWLTGFFILPNKRKQYKTKVWNQVINHFDKDFNVGILLKNKPARKFLLNNGCITQEIQISNDGIGEIMIYKKVGK